MALCTSVKSHRAVLQGALEDESKQQPSPELTTRKQLKQGRTNWLKTFHQCAISKGDKDARNENLIFHTT